MNDQHPHSNYSDAHSAEDAEESDIRGDLIPERPREVNGRNGPEPTRYGDWEKNGRCIDF